MAKPSDVMPHAAHENLKVLAKPADMWKAFVCQFSLFEYAKKHKDATKTAKRPCESDFVPMQLWHKTQKILPCKDSDHKTVTPAKGAHLPGAKS